MDKVLSSQPLTNQELELYTLGVSKSMGPLDKPLEVKLSLDEFLNSETNTKLILYANQIDADIFGEIVKADNNEYSVIIRFYKAI